jgi:spermidine synthase
MQARTLTTHGAVISLGLSSVMTQLVLMRELVGVFSGNEMVFGIVLGNWLLLTGLGATLGRWVGRSSGAVSLLIAGLILAAVLPVLDVWAVRTLRNVVFVRGAMIDVTQTVVSCFVLLLPYCLISGFLFTLACAVLGRDSLRGAGAAPATPNPHPRGARSIGTVYLLDSVGMIVGGMLFTFVLIHLLSHFGCLYVAAFAGLFFAAALAVAERKRALAAAAAAMGVALVVLVSAADLDEMSTEKEYAGFRVEFRGHSPYGSLVVTESRGQFNFIQNGAVAFSTQNAGPAEEAVHYAMAQRPAAGRVLLVGGGAAGAAREILKYPRARVDYVELDGMVVRAARRYAPEALPDGRITVIEADARAFVRHADARYDVVIVGASDPSTSQANRYYTEEFFREVKRAMAPDGVLCLPLGEYQNHLSRQLARLIATGDRTLRGTFARTLIVPGGTRVFLLASDGELTEGIAERLRSAGVPTEMLTPGYLASTLSPGRFADVARARSPEAPVNTDFSPVLYYHHLLYWLSRFQVSFGLLEGALLAGLGLYLVWMRRVPLVIFSGGFSASALEVVLLLGFQILYGSVYHRLGLIVTRFMAGLAAGSWIMIRRLGAAGSRPAPRDLAKLAGGLAAYAAALPLVLMGMDALTTGNWLGGAAGVEPVGTVVFAVLTLVLGALVGAEFPLAGHVDFGGTTATAGRLYTADMIGACLGALLVSTLMIPLLGVTLTCLAAAGLNALGAALLWVRK